MRTRIGGVVLGLIATLALLAGPVGCGDSDDDGGGGGSQAGALEAARSDVCDHAVKCVRQQGDKDSDREEICLGYNSQAKFAPRLGPDCEAATRVYFKCVSRAACDVDNPCPDKADALQAACGGK